jgi:glycosyltransferase involved in cell wall biosynthesis
LFLGQCLKSIERQDYPNLDVIIIDGLSTDATAEVVARYGRLVTAFVSERDGGQADAVTKGLRLATGEIAHWHAADDLVMPGAFRRVAEEFSKYPDVDLVFSDGVAFDETRTRLHAGEYVRWVNFWTTLLFFGRFQSDCAYWRHRITAQALPLDNTKPLMCDEDFFLRLWSGHKHRWVPEPLGAFRTRPQQLSATLPTTHLQQDRRASREGVLRGLNISPCRRALLRLLWWPHCVAGTKLAPKMLYAYRFGARTLGLDFRRRQYSSWFFEHWAREQV